MAKDLFRLRRIYDKTDGRCHICHSELSFSNHGKHGTHRAWHIDHAIPLANGGSNHGNNLFAACIGCNVGKGTLSTRTARWYYGTTRAPYSKAKKDRIRQDNTTAGALVGGLLGAVGGPLGFFVGAAIGAIIGDETSPQI